MQKLIFRNSIGVEIDLTKEPFGIVDWQGFSDVPLNLQTQQVPFNDGSVYLDGLLDDRTISVTLAMYDKNNLERRYQLRRQLISALNPKLGEGVLIYSNNYLTKQLTCVPYIPVFRNHNSNDKGTPKVMCTFKACNPYWEDLEETEVLMSGFNQEEVDYKGDYKTYPEIELIGSAVNPILRNIDNNTSLRLKGNVSDSIINLASGKKTFNKQDLGFFLNSESRTMFAESDSVQVLIGSATITITKDLNNFKVVKIAGNESFNCCAYGKGFFVVGGTNLIKSSDGENWENITKPSGMIQSCYYDETDEIFYFGIDGKLYSTEDLSTFSELATISYAINKIIKHNGIIYCVTNNNTSSEHGGCFKYDGETLTALSTGIKKNLYSIVSDGNNLIAVGASGTFIASADDGDTWISYDTTETLRDICFNIDTDLFIACGDNGLVGSGTIGNMVWVTLGESVRNCCRMSKLFGFVELLGDNITVFKNNSFESVGNIPNQMLCGVYLKNKYYAGGVGGTIYTSENLLDWETLSIGLTHDIVYAEGNDEIAYFATKEGDVAYTEDGITFETMLPSPYRNIFEFSAYFNNKYYCIGNGSSLLKSVYGKKWEVATDLYKTESTDTVCVANGKLFVSKSGYLLESSDGETFTTHNLPAGVSISGIYYFNNVYVCYGSAGTLFTTTDFSTFTQIYSDLYSSSTICTSIAVLNNNFYFILLDQETITSSLYQGDLTNSTLIKQYSTALASTMYYNNNNYIIDIYDYNAGGTLKCEKTTDFQTYTTYNYAVIVSDGREYHFTVNENEDRVLSYNDTVIFEGQQFYICQDLLFYENEGGDGWSIKNLITLEIITSPLSSIVSCYWDSNCLFAGSGANVYKIFKSEITSAISEGWFLKLSGLAGYGNYLYVISEMDTNPIRYIHQYDKSTGEHLRTITSGTYQSADLSNGIENIKNGIMVASDKKIVWFETSQDESIDRICVHNLITGEQERTPKTVNVYDMIFDNHIFYAIGYGGVLHAVEGENWSGIYNASFVFRYFIRNKNYYFVGLYHYLGYLEYLIGENIIEQVESLSLCLEAGINQLVLTYDSGAMTATLKYRQKYIGV